MRPSLRMHACALIALLMAGAAPAQPPAATPAQPDSARAAPARAERKPQTRPHGVRIAIDPSKVVVDDGDTAFIHWSATDTETVRFLGIDTPETRHVAYDLPYAQPFGPEARAFAQGTFAVATKVELLRANTLDPYGRTLGYFFLNDKSYSVLVVSARLAEESVTRYGDNGFPAEAAAVVAAAKAAGPLPFESPGNYRRRMRDVSLWMKSKGMSPDE